MGVTLEHELWVLPLIVTVIVFVLALANVVPERGALATFRNGSLLVWAGIAAAAVWIMWAAVLR